MSRYPSKILLFGEYAIIHRSMALAIPYHGFYGEWKQHNSKYDTSAFADYLDDLEIEDLLFDRSLYEIDQEDGLSFSSNIPQGYGVGSSGALTAAFYERYIIRNRDFDLATLLKIFAKMESFFHGSSSGFDPLISHLNKGLIIDENKQPSLVDKKGSTPFVVYLINSRKSRQTSPLVKMYQKKYLGLQFQKGIAKLIQLNETAINEYISNSSNLIETFYQISALEKELFPEMIIPEIEDTYKKLHLKLCGAGGGGFYLGITSKKNIPKLIRDHDIILIE